MKYLKHIKEATEMISTYFYKYFPCTDQERIYNTIMQLEDEHILFTLYEMPNKPPTIVIIYVKLNPDEQTPQIIWNQGFEIVANLGFLKDMREIDSKELAEIINSNKFGI